MSQPKIMVFHLKELVYTMVLFAFCILLVVLFIVFLLPKLTGYGKDAGTMSDSTEETSDADPATSAEISGANSGTSSPESAGAVLSDAAYYAGIYTSSYVMNNQTMEIEVVLDENHINSIRFVNVDDAVETVSPLLLPAMDSLAEQIVNSQSLDNLTAPEGSEYTYQVLIEAIRNTIEKGKVG